MALIDLTYKVLNRIPHGSVAATGVLKNFNTIEEFKAVDKTALFNQEAQSVCQYHKRYSSSDSVGISDLGSYTEDA